MIKDEFITGIIFSQFDEKVGPIAVAWIPPELSNEIMDRISLKSFNILSAEGGKVPQSLAIIPFPSQNLRGLIKSLEIKDKTRRGGVIDSTIILLFNEAEALHFYRNINLYEDLFNKQAEKMVKLIQTEVNKQKIESELKSFYSKVTDTIVAAFKKKAEPRTPKKSTLLLFNLVRKDLDKAVNALIKGDPVIVTGDKPLVELIVDTLTIFCTESEPQIIHWTEEFAPGDIIGGPTYPEVYESGLIINLNKGKVSGGPSNLFCKKLLKRARQFDSSHGEIAIKKNLQKIHSATKELIEMITQRLVVPASIDKFIVDLDTDELEFIKILAISQHPDIEKKIDATAAACRKKMSKILSGFEKQKW